jgi:hypothetical protein
MDHQVCPSLSFLHDQRRGQGSDCRVSDLLQSAQLCDITKHDVGKGLPVQRSIGPEHAGAEALSDVCQSRRSRFDHLACHSVGIDDHRAPFSKHSRHFTLSRTDAAGQADENHSETVEDDEGRGRDLPRPSSPNLSGRGSISALELLLESLQGFIGGQCATCGVPG